MALEKKEEDKSEWIEFPNVTLLNPHPSPYNFTNAYSKTVLLISDEKYVSKHIASYLDTTLHVSGFKVTKCNSISSRPLNWTNNSQHSPENMDEKQTNQTNDIFAYKINLNDFDSIIIPSQIHSNICKDITNETKQKLLRFIASGGSLICCHFRGAEFINAIFTELNWHEISVRIGASYHIERDKNALYYKNDIRGIVGVNKNNIIYKTKDDLITVAFKKYIKGMCYYIGHDYSEISAKLWNKILFNAIKKTLTNDDKIIGNLNFGDIDIEAFKNLNIVNYDNENDKKNNDIYLEEFQPDFKVFQSDKMDKNDVKKEMDNDGIVDENKNENVKKNKKNNDSFEGFDDLNSFDNGKNELTHKQYE
eukprot:209943_1